MHPSQMHAWSRPVTNVPTSSRSLPQNEHTLALLGVRDGNHAREPGDAVLAEPLVVARDDDALRGRQLPAQAAPLPVDLALGAVRCLLPPPFLALRLRRLALLAPGERLLIQRLRFAPGGGAALAHEIAEIGAPLVVVLDRHGGS
jgi:hypothetical protein